MKDPFRIFNLNEFKKWMEESKNNESKDGLVGSRVESKVSTKKLMEVCEVLEGDEKKVLKEFHLNGGTVLEKKENILLIKNKKGLFETHRVYIKEDC